METRLINPNECKFIQSRVLLDPRTVLEYSAMMDAGVAFDPCKGILTDTGAILVYDGNHRGEAAKVNGSMLEVELLRGTEQDAAWLSVGANTRHGLRRNPDDIAKSVNDALRHPRALGKSDRDIARHCGCDHKTVGKYRKELEASGERPQMHERTVTRNGTAYQMSIPMPTEPEPDTVYHVRDGKNVKVPLESVPCVDCGQAFQRPQGRGVISRCETCRHEFFRQKYAPGPGNVSTVLTGKDIHPGTKHGKQGAYEHRHQPKPWGCTRCLKHHPLGGWGFFYESGAQVCPMCIGEYDPCAVCKQARGSACADDCCVLCQPACNLQQRCRLNLIPKTQPEPEPEFPQHEELRDAVPKPEPSIERDRDDTEVCDFCGEEFPEGNLYKDTAPESMPDFYICLTCAQKALHALLNPNDSEVIADARRAEDEIFDPPIELDSQARNRIIAAGLRLFRGSEHEKVLKQYTPVNNSVITNDRSEITWGSWKNVERFPTKKALKDRIRALEQEPDVVIDGRL